MPADGAEESARCFLAWRSVLDADRDVSRDARMMTPVFYDVVRRKTKVWALLGWRTSQVIVDYQRPPAVASVRPDESGAEAIRGLTRQPPPVQFSGDSYEFAVPVMAEAYVSRLLDRDEFRRHCDRHGTRSAILANLR
jgi:hypothetical protein